jgi:outer membrane receptor for ferrienterochelin and colicins
VQSTGAFRSRVRALWWVITLTACSASSAVAQTPADLGQIPLEELMRLGVQRVFGAADRVQPVTEVPSAVTIITAEEIARYGYRTLADVLQGVRGFYITNDRNYSYVGTRGFNRPGDYSTRVLLLVNGHRVNDNVFDQANIGAEFGIDTAMFERVEVIRGPASSLYGANALFAIVNVVTRTGAALKGAEVDAQAGTLGTQSARISAGRRLKNGIDFAVSGSYEQSDGAQQLYLPEFDVPGGNGGVASGLDGEQSGQIYGRLSVNNLTLTATSGRRLKDVPTASFATIFNAHDPAEQTTDYRTTLSAQYVRSARRARVTTEAAVDNFGYAGVYPYADEQSRQSLVAFRDGFRGLRWMINSRAERSFRGRHTVTVGGEFADNLNQDQWGHYAFESPENFVLNQSSKQGAAFAQDEIRLRSWLLVNGGLRHDRYSRFNRTTPRGAVIVMPTANHSLKYLYGRAFRPPNAYELYYYRDASSYLQPESVATHEWVWEAYFGERVRTAASAYRYRASQLVDLAAVEEDASVIHGFAFSNAGEIHAAGLELESEIRLKRGAQALGSYSLQNAADAIGGGQRLTNSPRHVAKLRVSVPGPRARSFASLEWQHLSSRRTISGTTVAPASVANATFNWPLGRSLTLTGQVRNLLNARYSDPASDEHAVDAIEQNGRTLRVGIRFGFWSTN